MGGWAWAYLAQTPSPPLPQHCAPSSHLFLPGRPLSPHTQHPGSAAFGISGSYARLSGALDSNTWPGLLSDLEPGLYRAPPTGGGATNRCRSSCTGHTWPSLDQVRVEAAPLGHQGGFTPAQELRSSSSPGEGVGSMGAKLVFLSPGNGRRIRHWRVFWSPRLASHTPLLFYLPLPQEPPANLSLCLSLSPSPGD